jgi:hypothetical protein
LSLVCVLYGLFAARINNVLRQRQYVTSCLKLKPRDDHLFSSSTASTGIFITPNSANLPAQARTAIAPVSCSWYLVSAPCNDHRCSPHLLVRESQHQPRGNSRRNKLLHRLRLVLPEARSGLAFRRIASDAAKFHVAVMPDAVGASRKSGDKLSCESAAPNLKHART